MLIRMFAAAVTTGAIVGIASAQTPPAKLPVSLGAEQATTDAKTDKPKPAASADSKTDKPKPAVPVDSKTDISKLQPSPVLTEAPSVCMTCLEPGPRVWFDAEYLLWWTKPGPVPFPVVTTGVAPDAPIGAIGQPNTRVLLGNGDVDQGLQNGGRFTGGYWFGEEHCWGVEGGYFFLASSSVTQSVSSSGLPGSPILTIPFLDVTLPTANAVGTPLSQENSTFLANPNPAAGGRPFAGTGVLTLQSQLQGAELNAVRDVSNPKKRLRVSVLGGFRYVNLNESLNFATSSPFVGAGPQDVFLTIDRFNANNNFYGGQVGFHAEQTWGRFFINGTGKIALGAMFENIAVNGILTTNDFNKFGTPQTFAGGYFTQPTNIGTLSHTQLAAIPEVNLNFGFQVFDHARLYMGYSFLYISGVARPGNQVDRAINPTQSLAIDGTNVLAGAARPAPSFGSGDFWAQGLNFGLELRY